MPSFIHSFSIALLLSASAFATPVDVTDRCTSIGDLAKAHKAVESGDFSLCPENYSGGVAAFKNDVFRCFEQAGGSSNNGTSVATSGSSDVSADVNGEAGNSISDSTVASVLVGVDGDRTGDGTDGITPILTPGGSSSSTGSNSSSGSSGPSSSSGSTAPSSHGSSTGPSSSSGSSKPSSSGGSTGSSGSAGSTGSNGSAGSASTGSDSSTGSSASAIGEADINGSLNRIIDGGNTVDVPLSNTLPSGSSTSGTSGSSAGESVLNGNTLNVPTLSTGGANGLSADAAVDANANRVGDDEDEEVSIASGTTLNVAPTSVPSKLPALRNLLAGAKVIGAESAANSVVVCSSNA